jgi:hypothetical protein
MSLSPVTANSIGIASTELHNPAPAPAAKQAAPSPLPSDTVSLSHTAQKESAGNADHDSD